jgi:hypothetical protein
MPHPSNPSVNTPRYFAVPVVLTGLLILALASAFALETARGTGTKPYRIGDLGLPVPNRWQESAGPENARGLNMAVGLQDPDSPQRQLLIAGVRSQKPRAPMVVLDELLDSLLSEQVRAQLKRTQPVLPFTTEKVCGLWYTGIVVNENKPTLHHVLVFTSDARRYWVLHLSHGFEALDQQQLEDSLRSDGHLVSSILTGVDPSNLRDATAEDCVAAGLNPSFHTHIRDSGLRACVPISGMNGDPIELVPRVNTRGATLLGTRTGVQLIRIRDSVDLREINPASSLSPVSMLANEFLDSQGRLPAEGEIAQGQIAGAAAWWATFPQADAMLIRQLWHITLDHGKTFLIETICEPQGLSLIRDQIQTIVKAADEGLSDPHSTTAEPTQDFLKTAMERGKHLTQRQLNTFVHESSDPWTFYLIEVDGELAGCEIEQLLPTDPDNPECFEGIDLSAVMGKRAVQTKQQWIVDKTQAEFALYSEQVILSETGEVQTLRKEHLVLEDGTLSLSRVGRSSIKILWEMPAPSGLVLPMVKTRWPTRPEDWDGPALIWMFRGNRPPTPHWAQVVTPSRENPPGDPPIHVIVRPLMSLDFERLTLDAEGNLIQYQTRRPVNFTGGSRTTIQKVDRGRLFESFPQVEEDLRRWESEQQSSEKQP